MINIIESKDYEFLNDIAIILNNNNNIKDFYFYKNKSEYFVKFRDNNNNSKILKIDNKFCEKYIKLWSIK